MYTFDLLKKLPKNVLLFVFVFLFSCSEQDDPAAPVAPAPTLPVVDDVLIRSKTFNDLDLTSTIRLTGTTSAQDYGFVYAETPINVLAEGTKISLGSLTGTKPFSYKLSGLKKLQQYFVRAYAVSEGTTILGKETTFTTYGLNTWFPVEGVSGLNDMNANCSGLQLSMEGKGYIGFGGEFVNDKLTIPLYEYNPTTNAVTKMPICPAEFYAYTKRFTLNKNVYVIAKNKVWKLDTSSNQWKPLSDTPSTLYPRTAFTVNEEGWLIATNNDTNKPELWVYDETNDSWTLRSVMNVETLHIEVYGVIVLNSKLYIVTAIAAKPAQLFEYDIAQNAYTSLNAPPVEIPLSSVTDTYAISTSKYGYFVNKETWKIWQYNPIGDSWTTVSTPTPQGFNLFALNDEIYSVGYADMLYRYVPE